MPSEIERKESERDGRGEVSFFQSEDNVSICVTTVRKPGPCGIVFIHGILQSALSWKYQLGADELEDYTTIAFDLRGHGHSSKPIDPTCYRDANPWARDLSMVIDRSGLERVLLVGWSFGGRVMLDFLAEMGTDPRVAGLIFINANTKTAPGHTSVESGRALMGATSEQLHANIAAREEFVRMCFHRAPSEADMLEMVAYNNMTPSNVLKAIMGRSMDHDTLMRRLDLPALVIHGREDRLALLRCAEHTAATIPNATLHVLDGVGHTPQLEASSLVNAFIRAFAISLFHADEVA